MKGTRDKRIPTGRVQSRDDEQALRVGLCGIGFDRYWSQFAA